MTPKWPDSAMSLFGHHVRENGVARSHQPVANAYPKCRTRRLFLQVLRAIAWRLANIWEYVKQNNRLCSTTTLWHALCIF